MPEACISPNATHFFTSSAVRSRKIETRLLSIAIGLSSWFSFFGCGFSSFTGPQGWINHPVSDLVVTGQQSVLAVVLRYTNIVDVILPLSAFKVLHLSCKLVTSAESLLILLVRSKTISLQNTSVFSSYV